MLLTAFAANVQMFVDERGDLFHVHSLEFVIHKFIEAGVQVCTVKILGARLFEHAEEFENDLIRQFGLRVEVVADSVE